MLVSVLSISAAFLVSFLFTWYLSLPNAILNIMDHPNERSLHSQSVPRTGGVSIFLAMCIGISVMVALSQLRIDRGMTWMGLGVLIVAFISFLDDRYGLSVVIRFSIHIIAACLIIVGGWVPGMLSLPLVTFVLPYISAVLFTLLFILWMTNLYNFMDGMDGFAAGMAIFGFSTLGIAGYLHGDPLFAITNGLIASSAAGFLVFNFPPAKIFMGDIGSSTLGYLAAAMLLWAEQSGIMPIWLGVLLFSPFIVDATVTLIRRILKGDKFWLAHKTHYYQRLVELGWGHRRTVLAEYGAMLLVSLTVLSILRQPNGLMGFILLVSWGLAYLLLAFAIQHMERARV